MATRNETPSVKAVLTKGAPLVEVLQGAKVDAEGGVPPGVEDALSQLAVLASDLVKARTDDEQAIVDAAGGPATRAHMPDHRSPCEGLNTYWDTMKSFFGFHSDWEECMCREYDAYC